MSERRSYWLDEPKNVAKLYYGVWICGALLVILDFVVHRHEPLAAAELFGFHALYGFFAGVALVLAAKGLRVLLRRPEDYYER